MRREKNIRLMPSGGEILKIIIHNWERIFLFGIESSSTRRERDIQWNKLIWVTFKFKQTRQSIKKVKYDKWGIYLPSESIFRRKVWIVLLFNWSQKREKKNVVVVVFRITKKRIISSRNEKWNSNEMKIKDERIIIVKIRIIRNLSY